ncbi:MAG: sodium-translocating pyrophosphatase [Candidatus Bathyarchaeales archaeon]
MDWLLIAPIAGLISVLTAVYLYFYISKQDGGNEKMREIASAIKEGANAYLKRQNLTLAIFVIIVATIMLIAFWDPNSLIRGPSRAIAYIIGSACSGIAGYFGMNVALRANVRTANGARSGLSKAFPVAFYGGAVMGLSVVGLALIGISGLYYIFEDPEIVLSFSFGASAMALFAKAGGGIYTKTADIGADLVGKVEIGIPEDDPRNPAVIADNVGDNVGDVAGMGADLFDSYVASIVAAMILGATIITIKEIYVILPMLLAGAGIFASILGMAFMKIGVKNNPGASLNRGTYITCVIFALLTLVLKYALDFNWGIFYSTIAGLVAGVVIGMTTDFFTSIDRKPVKKTAESAKTGAAINILSGFSYGIISIVPPIIGICIATIASWNLATIGLTGLGLTQAQLVSVQVFGVAISAVGMLSIVGMIVSADAYGPIVDNAKGIAEQAGIEKEFVDVADKLDAAGNTAKAITKGFAIGAAALTVIALFVAYAEIANIPIDETTGLYIINIANPYVLAGAFIGGVMPPLISALLILGVGRNAHRMVVEIRRQFKEIPGLLEGTGKPDYARCVDIATKGALKELVLPSILAMIVPIIVGFTLGKEALAGFLAGSIITGIIFALLMANSGGTWDNAKKFVEAGNLGGKGSDTHKAAVVGDTVGDPFKDTAGPTLNTMITVMSLVSSVFAPILVMVLG